MDEIECTGHWFLPQDDLNRIPGTLTYNIHRGIVLKLIGGFQRLDYNIVLGDIGGTKRIALYGAYVTSRKGFNEPVEMEMTANVLFEGTWINSINDLRIYSASLKFLYSEAWFGKPGVNYTRSVNSKIGYEIDQPPTVAVDLDTKSVLKIRSFCNTKLTSTPTPTITLTDKTYFDLIWKQGLSFQIAMKNILHLLNFFILTIQTPSYILELNLTLKLRGNRTQKYLVKAYYPQINIPETQKLHSSNLLISYSSIEATFPTIIKQWFNLQIQLQTSLNPYMANFHSKYSYVSDKFLNLTASLEAFHRDLMGLKRMDFIDRVKGILKQHSKTYNSKLKVKSIPNIAKEIKNRRNDWTHSNLLTSDPKESMRIHILSEFITLVMACAFLEKAGVDNKILKERILSSHRYKKI